MNEDAKNLFQDESFSKPMENYTVRRLVENVARNVMGWQDAFKFMAKIYAEEAASRHSIISDTLKIASRYEIVVKPGETIQIGDKIVVHGDNGLEIITKKETDDY